MTFTARSLPRVAVLLAVSALSMGPRLASAAEDSGVVYVMTNRNPGNAVVQFLRGADGSLTRGQTVPTGGWGSGGTLDPLTSQDSLVLSKNGKVLLAVNAGSDEISVLGVGSSGLALLDKVPSGGDFPNSVALDRSLVYVLNANTPNITGFRLDGHGQLHAIPGSTRALPGGSAALPSDIHFSPDGNWLLVTERGTNQIDVFAVEDDGLTGDVEIQPTPGSGPLGLRFGHDGVVVVVEATSASASSYLLDDDGTLDVVSGAVPDGQAASCWLSLHGNGKFAYVSNTGASTLSSFQVGPTGALTLLQGVAATTGDGSAPIDSALSRNSKFLYVQDSTRGRILIFRTAGADLVPVGVVSGLPTSLQGIAAQ